MSKVKFQRATKSSRELRRMAQREQTREQRQAAIDAFWKLSPEERAQRIADNEAFQRISKNGITIEDMHKAEEDAYSKGVKDGKDGAVKTVFAAIVNAGPTIGIRWSNTAVSALFCRSVPGITMPFCWTV